MLLADFDLFFFWRRILVFATTIYAIIQLARSGYSWYVQLRSPGRPMAIARQYLLIQLLRISPRRFAWQLLDLAILLAIVLILIGLHVPAGG